MKERLDFSLADPLLPVEKRQLEAGNLKSKKYAVIYDPQGEEPIEVGTVSQDYVLVPNSSAHQTILDLIERTGIDFTLRKHAFDGRRWRQRWIAEKSEGMVLEVKKGDFVALGIDAVNSYDGSTSFGINFIAERLTCNNGMVCDFELGAYKFRHWGRSDELKLFEEEVKHASESIVGLGNGRGAKLLHKLQLMTQHKLARHNIQKLYMSMGVSTNLIADSFMRLKGDTLYDFYNSLTEALSQKDSIRNDNTNRRFSEQLFQFAELSAGSKRK